MKKGVLVLLFTIFLLAFALAEVGQEYQWHSSDIILVEINGFNVTVQDAINNNYFGSVLPTANSDYPFYSHLASEILIRTPNGYTMTLQEASDTDSFVVGVSDGTIEENTGHLADDINVYSKSGEIMTLQELIDYGKMFCKTCEDFSATCGNYNDGCGETLNCGSCGDDEYCHDGTCSTIAWAVGDWGAVSSCGDKTNREVSCVARVPIGNQIINCYEVPGDCGNSRIMVCPPQLVCPSPSTTFDNEIVADSVCYDALGTSSKPDTRKSTSCAWVKGSRSSCADLSTYIEYDVNNEECYQMVAKSCSAGTTDKCLDAGTSCKYGSCNQNTGSYLYNMNCGIVYPAVGNYLDLESLG